MDRFTVQDLIPFFSLKPGKKIDLDTVLPIFIMPILLLISSLDFFMTLIIFGLLGMAVLYINTKPMGKVRTPFFYSWTLVSALCLFLIFEFGILNMLEITQEENLLVLFLIIVTSYCFYKVRTIAESITSGKNEGCSSVLTADSQFCPLCQIEIKDRYFHTVWWDCCISEENYIYFLSGNIAGCTTLLYGSNLGLTTVCQPYVAFWNILLPEDCSAIYGTELALSFVASIYAFCYMLVIAVVLLHQLVFYFPKYFGFTGTGISSASAKIAAALPPPRYALLMLLISLGLKVFSQAPNKVFFKYYFYKCTYL